MAEKAVRVKNAPKEKADGMFVVPRPGNSLVSFWVVTGAAVLLVGDSLVQGDVRYFARVVPFAALVLWGLWLILYRPRISFDETHAVIVNPGRIIDIPWQRATDVRQRLQIVVELDNGAHVTCWGSPFPEKPGRVRPTRESRQAADVAGPLEEARRAFSGGQADAQVTRRWDTVALGVGAVIVVACVADLLFL